MRKFYNRNYRKRARIVALDFHSRLKGIFPICGTLLGIVRENDLIKHDCDIDFGCFEWPETKEIERIYRKEREFHYRGVMCEMAFRHKKSGIKIDLFLMRKENGEYVFIAWPDEFPNRKTIIRRFPKEILELGKTRIWGKEIKIFKNSEKYLEMNYGNDWRKINKKFKYE